MPKANSYPLTVVDANFERSFGAGRTLMVAVRDLLGAPVDAIVNPANSGLSHGGGLAAQIAAEAGPDLEHESDQIIEQLGRIPVGKAVVTTAGRLPYKGVIHAVGPKMGSGSEGTLIAKAVVNSLRQADRHHWTSIALPAISTGIFGVPRILCAQAFAKALPYYWTKFADAQVGTVWLCLTTDDYPEFAEILKGS